MTPLVRIASAFDDATLALAQAVAVLRATPLEADLRRFGVDDPADLPVGAADRMLLAVHEGVLGRPVELTVDCAECAEPMTMTIDRESVGDHAPRSAWRGPGTGAREPTYADLLAAAGDADVLLRRCTVGDGGTIDDLARVEGSLCGPMRSTCLTCGADVAVDIDIMTLALRGLAAVPAEVDLDVHILAARYGWDLAVIEALPDDRRRRLAALGAGAS